MNKKFRPLILYEGKYTKEDLEELKRNNKIWEELNIYKPQLEELFEVLHPDLRLSSEYQRKLKDYIDQKIKENLNGNWIYYPWNGYLIHTVNEDEFNMLRTNRNKNLITKEEQEKLMNSCVGFVGLSIGSHFAVGMAYSGISKTMKFAEFDTLSTSNLNRIKAGIKDLGAPKINLTSQQIYDINPYANLIQFPKGLNDHNLKDFIYTDKKLNIIFEAIDDFEMKIKLRLKAREAGVPVIMFTNLGDNVLVDVERYDLDSKSPLFNGLIGNTPEEILSRKVTEKDKIRYAIKIVGLDNTPTRALKTLFEINKALVGRPQLYSTVTISGGFASYLVRRLLLEKSLPSGRLLLSFKDVFHFSDEIDNNEGREEIINKIRENFNI